MVKVSKAARKLQASFDSLAVTVEQIAASQVQVAFSLRCDHCRKGYVHSEAEHEREMHSAWLDGVGE